MDFMFDSMLGLRLKLKLLCGQPFSRDRQSPTNGLHLLTVGPLRFGA